MPKVKTHGWSVAGQKKLDGIKPNTPPEMVEQIKQQASEQGIADVFGADWKEHVDAHGNPQEQGIGSTAWLVNVDEGRAERHYAAIARFVGPAAAQAERDRIARLKGNKGKWPPPLSVLLVRDDAPLQPSCAEPTPSFERSAPA